MPRPLRHLPAGGYYHVYNRAVAGQPLFTDRRDFEFFLKLFVGDLHSFGVRCFAYCLMGNHFHFGLSPEKERVSKMMHDLQGRYARWFNGHHKRYGALFQGRFGCKVLKDATYVRNLIGYIHNNPVEAGACLKPEDYEWSSCRAYLGSVLWPEWLSWPDQL